MYLIKTEAKRPGAGMSHRMLTGFSPLKTKKKHNRYDRFLGGFTLVEIMVVVAIVVIVVTLAISLMLRNRIVTNEAVAIASAKIISSACQSYYAANIPHAYPDGLTRLGPLESNPPYIDKTLASGTRTGYNFLYKVGEDGESFTLRAEPTVYQRTGNRYFYLDETGRVTAKEGESAGPGDPAV